MLRSALRPAGPSAAVCRRTRCGRRGEKEWEGVRCECARKRKGGWGEREREREEEKRGAHLQ